MKGDIVNFDRQTREDPETGVPVTRYSVAGGEVDHPYFTASQVDEGGAFALVTSSRTGSEQFYMLGLADGHAVQLTAEDDVHSGCLDGMNRRAFYFAGRTLKAVELDDLAEQELMEVPSGFIPASLTCTHDGRYLAFTMVELADAELCTARFEAEFSGGSKGFREKFFRYPSSVIIRYDVETQTGYAVTGELRRMTHVIIHPLDADIILFCHEGPWHLVQRMWVANVATDEVHPLIETKRHLERVGHEFFTAGGRVGTQYSYRYRSDMDWLHHADIYVNPDGSDEQRYYYPYRRPMHVHAHPSEPMAVGDTGQIREEDPDWRRYISLVKYDDARHWAIVGRLCAHDTSWRKTSHPHPVFTPDGTHVLWASDTGGRMNLYLAPADWDACIRSDQ